MRGRSGRGGGDVGTGMDVWNVGEHQDGKMVKCAWGRDRILHTKIGIVSHYM